MENSENKETFVVSARKYRPNTFDTVVGQSHITDTLKNAIRSKQLAQAFLFCGPRGVGKTTCSRILAKTINCLNLTKDTEACNECSSCKAFNEGNSLNISELDAASNNSVEDIRNLIEQVRYPPQAGKKKVYIIDEVHMLSNQAFNAFLKTLEEPPAYAIFILATTEKHKIIPTILSRCQIFDFNRIQPNDVARHLEKIAKREGIDAEEEALQLVGRKADGALRDALSIFDMLVTFSPDRKLTYSQAIENLHVLDYDYYFKLTDAFLERNHSQALLIFDEILKKGFDGHNFVVGMSEHFRDLLVCKDVVTISLLEVSEAVKEKYKQQANRASFSFLMSALNIASTCELQYKSSKNQRLHVEIALLKLSHVSAALSIPQLVEDLKKKSLTNSTTPSVQQATASSQIETKPHHQTTPQSTSSSVTSEGWRKTPRLTTQIIPKKQEEKTQITSSSTDVSTTATYTERSTAFDSVTFRKAWQSFFSRSTSSFASMLLHVKITVKDCPNVALEMPKNIALQSEFERVKVELMPYLANELANDRIVFHVSYTETQAPQAVKTLTEQEKLNLLIQKYPLLGDVMQRFGLSLD